MQEPKKLHSWRLPPLAPLYSAHWNASCIWKSWLYEQR